MPLASAAAPASPRRNASLVQQRQAETPAAQADRAAARKASPDIDASIFNSGLPAAAP